MAKLPRRYRDSITGLLVENGMSKADAKTYLQTEPSGTQLGNQLSDLYLASLRKTMNKYAAQYGTAIDLFSGNGNATQVISTPVGRDTYTPLPTNQGMDGNGDYYDQSDFSAINGLTAKLLPQASKRSSLIEYKLVVLSEDADRLKTQAKTKYGVDSKAFAVAKRMNHYLDNTYTVFSDASEGSPFEDLLGPYYSELKGGLYGSDGYNSTSDYIFYTSQLVVSAEPINLPPGGLVFAIQQVDADQNYAPSLSQAIYGDVTINFADAPVMNTLYLLGAGANGDQSGDLIINFADGSTPLAYTLNFTDWANNKNQKVKRRSNPSLSLQSKPYNDEIVLEVFTTYINANKNGVGKAENNYRYIFGYGINVASPSPVSSIDFNFSDNVKILAASYM
jgi:hypothetical protein